MYTLAICGRYCETGIKLLCSLEAGTELKQETLDKMFLIQYAQEEYAALLVSGQFDASTAKVSRFLKKNTSGFDLDSLENLWAAVMLSVVGLPTGYTEDRYTARRGFPVTGWGCQSGAYNSRSQTPAR